MPGCQPISLPASPRRFLWSAVPLCRSLLSPPRYRPLSLHPCRWRCQKKLQLAGMLQLATEPSLRLLGAWNLPLLRLISLVTVSIATLQIPNPSVGSPTRFGDLAPLHPLYATVKWHTVKQRPGPGPGSTQPRSHHSPQALGACRLVRPSPRSFPTRNCRFAGLLLHTFVPPFPPIFLFCFSLVLSSYFTPPVSSGVTRYKGPYFGRDFHSNRLSTYPLGRVPNLLREPSIWCLAPMHPLLVGSHVVQTLMLGTLVPSDFTCSDFVFVPFRLQNEDPRRLLCISWDY